MQEMNQLIATRFLTSGF